MACQHEGGGWNFFSTFGWSTRSPFSRRGLAAFLLCCVFAVFLCFDNLRVLLERVVWLFMWFSFCFFFALCKTLVVDPGVRGTLVGFPVHPWSCVLLMLRLALSVRFVHVALRHVVLFLSSLLASVCSVELSVCYVGCAWGVPLSFACLPMPKTCV